MTYSFKNFQVSVFINNVKYESFHWNEHLVPIEVTLNISVIAHKIWMALIILIRVQMRQTLQNIPATEITPYVSSIWDPVTCKEYNSNETLQMSCITKIYPTKTGHTDTWKLVLKSYKLLYKM
jgi:hypothetical protein